MMKVFLLVFLWTTVRGDGTESTTQTTEQFTTNNSTPSSLNINKFEKPIVLNKLTSDNEYGIKSDNVLILNDKTLLIPNFYYNGNAPDAHFSIGNGSQPHEEGTIVPNLENLPTYNGQNITIELPDSFTVNNTDWLAVWCTSYRQNLASIFINIEESKYPPQTTGFQSVVKSGPVVLVNKKTLFIPNLVYDGSHLDTHFWVGNGTAPTSDGTLVPDEYGSVDNLGIYQHENLYIHLPNGTTTDNIDYFAVWSKSEETSLGHVIIRDIVGVPEATGFETKTSDGKTIMRVAKCCPISMFPTVSNCVYNSSLKFLPNFNIYRHNSTHIDNETMNTDGFKYEPYIYSMPCASVKYALHEAYENVALLQNGSLIVTGTGLQGILSQGDYCLDNTENDDGNYTVHALVCAPTNKISQAVFGLYTGLLIISTLCFAGILPLYWFILRPTDVHKKCFLFYSTCMCITFIFLVIVQFASVNITGCAVIGFFFQFFMICSFSWLAILCIDIDYMLKCTLSFVGHREESQNRAKTDRRFKYYVMAATAVPSLFFIISISRNGVPDVPDSFFKPQYERNTCYFEEESQRRILFYAPILISICLSIVFLILARLKITKGDKEYANNYFWIEDGKPYKLMFIRCLIILIAMTFCWVTDIIATYVDGEFYTADIIEALQGIITFGLLTSHHYYTTAFRKKQPQPQSQQETDGDVELNLHRRYIIMLIPMLIWLIEGIVALGGPNDGIKTAFDIIEASQGIFTLLLFVLNKNAKRQINETIQKRKRFEDFSMKTFLPNTNNLRTSNDNSNNTS